MVVTRNRPTKAPAGPTGDYSAYDIDASVQTTLRASRCWSGTCFFVLATKIAAWTLVKGCTGLDLSQ